MTTQVDVAGNITWQASYEAFGTRTREKGSNADAQRANGLSRATAYSCTLRAVFLHRFAEGGSKEEDPTGLLNEGFRCRDLEAGVFLSRDPAGFVDGPNVYCYVVQNPLNHAFATNQPCAQRLQKIYMKLILNKQALIDIRGYVNLTLFDTLGFTVQMYGVVDKKDNFGLMVSIDEDVPAPFMKWGNCNIRKSWKTDQIDERYLACSGATEPIDTGGFTIATNAGYCSFAIRGTFFNHLLQCDAEFSGSFDAKIGSITGRTDNLEKCRDLLKLYNVNYRTITPSDNGYFSAELL